MRLPAPSFRSRLGRWAAAGVAALGLLEQSPASPTLSPAEQEASVRQSLDAQKEQIRRGEAKARREAIQESLALFQQTGNLAFLKDCSSVLTSQEAIAELVPLLRHTNAEVRCMALQGLLSHGTGALPALPDIIARLGDTDGLVVTCAADGLAGLGKASVAALPALQRVVLTHSYSADARQAAATALGLIGPAAHGALPALDAAARDPDAGLADAALMAAGQIRRQPPLTCAELQVGGPSVFTGSNAFRALAAARAAVCPPEETAALLLKLLATSPPAALRMETYGVFATLKVETPEVVQAILDGFDDAEPRVVSAAGEALSKLPATNLALVPRLAQAVTEANVVRSIASAHMLARFGPAAAPAAPAMMEDIGRFHNSSDVARALACLAVVRAAGTNVAGQTRTNLAEFLSETAVIYTGLQQHEAHEMRAAVLLTLADVGPPSSALPAVLDEMANATSAEMLAAAVRTAGRMPEQHRTLLVSRLSELLREPGHDEAVALDDLEKLDEHFLINPGTNATSVCLESIRALSQMGLAARPALAAVRQRAQEPLSSSPFFPHYQREAAELAETLSKLP